MKVRMGIDDAPQPALERPAWFSHGSSDRANHVLQTEQKAPRQRMCTDIARSSLTPEQKAALKPAMVPITRTQAEKDAGVFLEAYRSKGRTHYRQIRTLDDGDEPLTGIVYRDSKVAR